MRNYKYLLRNKSIIGMSLIETIVSMWLLGIVIISMLSFIGVALSKQNQFRIQAMSLAKSELQEADLSIIDRNIKDHYTIILLKSTYLTTADENRRSVDDSNGTFYKKYIISKDEKDNTKTICEMIDSDTTNLSSLNKNTEDSVFCNNPQDSTVYNVNIDYDDLKVFFPSTNEEEEGNAITDSNICSKYHEIEQLFTGDIGNNSISEDIDGIKCFIMQTKYDIQSPTGTTSLDIYTNGNTITTSVKLIWESEKNNGGIRPLVNYKLSSETTIGNYKTYAH